MLLLLLLLIFFFGGQISLKSRMMFLRVMVMGRVTLGVTVVWWGTGRRVSVSLNHVQKILKERRTDRCLLNWQIVILFYAACM